MTDIPSEELPLLRVRLRRFPTLEHFIRGYARLVGRRGILLPSRDPVSVGTRLRFLVECGEPAAITALEGVGEVFRLETDAQGAPRAMMVTVERFSEATQATYDKLIDTKRALGLQVSADHAAVPEAPTAQASAPADQAHAEGETSQDAHATSNPGVPEAPTASPAPPEAVAEHSASVAVAHSATPDTAVAEVSDAEAGHAAEALDIRPTAQPTLRSEITGQVFTVSHMTGPQEIPLDFFGDDDLDSSFDSLFGGGGVSQTEEALDGIFASPEDDATSDPPVAPEEAFEPAPTGETSAREAGRGIESTPVSGVAAVAGTDRQALIQRIQERLNTGRNPAINASAAAPEALAAASPDADAPAAEQPAALPPLQDDLPAPTRTARPSGSRAAIEALLREADEEDQGAQHALRSLDARYGMATSEQPAVAQESHDEDTLDLGAYDRGDAVPLQPAPADPAPEENAPLVAMTDADGWADEGEPALHDSDADPTDDPEDPPPKKGFLARLFGRK